jgi:8-oxo-dGTP diphosphatase
VIVTELPIYDALGGSLVSLARLEAASLEGLDGSVPLARSLVVVLWGRRVLMGFNAGRQQWELPGGALEAGESAYDAALRELAEETGIRAERVSLVARAEFMFGGEATRHLAAVFTVAADSAPDVVGNDEMDDFGWWDPAGELWDGMSPVDAEVARRCLPRE